jgi:hypothetical protein
MISSAQGAKVVADTQKRLDTIAPPPTPETGDITKQKTVQPETTTPTTPPESTTTGPSQALKDMSIALAPKPTAPNRPIKEPTIEQPKTAVNFQKDLLKASQGEINQINKYAAQQIEALKPRQEERVRENASVNTLTGLAGSTEANRTTGVTKAVNEKENQLVRAEASAKISSILTGVKTKALEMAQTARQQFRLDTETANKERIARVEEAVNNASMLAQSGVTYEGLQATDPEAFKSLAETVGGEQLLKAQFTLNRPQEDILDKKIENGKYVIAYRNPLTGETRIESVDLGLPPQYTKTVDAGNRILAIPDNWDGDPSKLLTINKGLTPSQQASAVGGGASALSPAAQSWAQLIREGGAKISNVPATMRNEVARALASSDPVLSKANQNALQEADAALTAISNTKEIMKGIGSGGSAIQRGLFGMLPGTEARSVNNNIDTIKALIGFDALARMRAASPTGGALGAITERELAFLQSVQGSLDPLQKTSELDKTLNRIENSFKRVRAINSVNMTSSEYKDMFPDATPEELAEIGSRRELANTLEEDTDTDFASQVSAAGYNYEAMKADGLSDSEILSAIRQ